MQRARVVIFISIFLRAMVAMSAGPVSLEFHVKGMLNGNCKIFGVLGSTNYIVDSFPSAKEKASYTAPKLLPAGLYYFVLPEKGFFQFLLDQNQKMSMETDTSDFVRHMRISGNEDNLLFYDNLKYELSFHEKLDSVDAAIKNPITDKAQSVLLESTKEKLLNDRKGYLESLAKYHPGAFFTHFKLAGQNPELQYPKKPDGTLDSVRQMILYRDAYWNNTSISDEKLLRTPVIANKLNTYITQLIPQNADSVIKYAGSLIEQSKPCPECFKFIVNSIAIQYQKHTFMGDEKILVYLADHYFTDSLAREWFKDNPAELTRIHLKADDLRASLIGCTGQDLRCRNLDGMYENLYSLKTPIKILFMYNPECSHCQEQTPQLKALLERWKGKVDVFALCIEKDDAEWRAFVTKYHIESFHNVIDPDYESLYYKKYHVENTPGIYVLDSNNKIVAKDLYPNYLDEIFQQILTQGKN